jgi:cytidylate kinase
MAGRGGDMQGKHRSVLQIVDEQVKRWRGDYLKRETKDEYRPVVTISRAPGSCGRIVAEEVAKELGFDLFHQEVVHKMAESAKISARLLESLDEKGLSILEDWVSSFHRNHMWPDQYMKHLMKVVGTIGKHGRAVIVGRGANFLLSEDKTIRVRIVAPLKCRAENISLIFDISMDEAREIILKTESDRKAFVKKYFNKDITDPLNYDLLINAERLSIDESAGIIESLVMKKFNLYSPHIKAA